MTKFPTILTLMTWLVLSASSPCAWADPRNPGPGTISASVDGSMPGSWPDKTTGEQTNNQAPEKKALPQAIISELNFDAGFVDKGEVVKHDFLVKNEGDGLLLIENVSPG